MFFVSPLLAPPFINAVAVLTVVLRIVILLKLNQTLCSQLTALALGNM